MTSILTTLIGLPFDSSGTLNGLELMPAALRAAGLLKSLPLRDRGDLPLYLDDPTRDLSTGVIGYETLIHASQTSSDALASLFAHDEKPLVLGGDCTVLIGVAAALRRQFDQVGLAFVDGHLDFYDGHTSPTGEGADMELAILNGIGAPALIHLAGDGPLLSAENIVVIGPRDEEEARTDGALDPRTLLPAMSLYDVNAIRAMSPHLLGQQLVERFVKHPGSFWLHLDLDVIAGTLLPAVDYPMVGGLTWEEATELLKPLATSTALIGADCAIYNPKLDRTGRYAKRIVQFLAEVFSLSELEGRG